MKAVAATFFDGKTPRRQAAVLTVEGDEIVAAGAFGQRRAARAAVEISEPLGQGPRFVRFPDGSLFEVAELAAFGRWLHCHGFAAGRVARLQARWSSALLAIVATTLIVAAAYLWGLPAASQALAPRVPEAILRSLSESTMAVLDSRVLEPTHLPEARQAALAARVAGLRGGNAWPAYRLHFRSAQGLPNAFALPAGDIVIFDELVGLAASDDEVAAVIAHELGHVAHHHGIRQLIQSSVVSFVAGVYFGDISSLVSGLSTLALQSHYSRDFEREADAYAVRAMRAAGRDPGALATMLERIEASHGSRSPAQSSPWQALSSHPETAERVRRIRAAD